MKITALENSAETAVSEVGFIGRLHLASLMHRFTQAEVRQKLKLSKVTVIQLLATYAESGFLLVEQVGRTKLYSLNLSHPIVKQAKVFVNVSVLYWAALELARKLACEVYLFGSAARGEDIEKSDIDLLIIGEKVSQNVIMAEMASVEEYLERKITAQVFTKLEWAQASRKDKPFYERVEKDKIKLA